MSDKTDTNAGELILSLGRHETVELDSLRPYWRNPRRISDEEVNMLVKSLTDYGYQQPIVVDEDYVLIVGHTRYTALRRMDVTEVPVIVATNLTPAQVKQYRLIDNRAGEYSGWDFEKLTAELGELDQNLLMAFFPEIGGFEEEVVDHEADAEAEWAKVDTGVEFTCPSCFHDWEIEVTREDIMAGVVDPRTKSADQIKTIQEEV